MHYTVYSFRLLLFILLIFGATGILLVIIKPDDCSSPILNMKFSYYLLALSLSQLVAFSVGFTAYLQVEDKISSLINSDENFNEFLFMLNIIYNNIYYNSSFLILCTFKLVWFIIGFIIIGYTASNCLQNSILSVYTTVSYFANLFFLIIEIPSFCCFHKYI